MKKILFTIFFLLFLIKPSNAQVIWKNGDYATFLPKKGYYLFDGKFYSSLTVDPSAGGGVVASAGSLGVRDNAGVGELWLKEGAANTAWAQALTTSTGWKLLGNAGTNEGVNFLGTTDTEGLSIRTDSAQRQFFSDIGKITFTPLEMEVNGTVGTLATGYNTFYMGQQFTGTVAGTVYGPFFAPSFIDAISGFGGFTVADTWQAGSSVTGHRGYGYYPNFQVGSSLTSGISAVDLNPNFAAGTMLTQDYNGIASNGTFNSDMGGYNAVQNAPTFNSVMNGASAYSDAAQIGATASLGIYKALNFQPNVAAGATLTSYVGFFNGLNVAAGVTINDYTGVQINPDVDSNMTTYQGLLLNNGGSGDVTNYQEINIASNAPGNVTNYTMFNGSPNMSGTITNVVGINSNVSSLTSPNQRQTFSGNGGALINYSTYDTSINPASPGFLQLNQLGGALTIAAGSPMTNTLVFGTNLGPSAIFDDDMGPDAFGGFLGFTANGMVNQTTIANTKTVDTFNQLAVATSVPSGAGGTITNGNSVLVAGFVNGGGSISVTNYAAFHGMNNLCGLTTNCFGVKIDDALAGNYFAGYVQSDTSLILQDPGVGTNKWTIQSPTLAADYTLTLPVDDGLANQALITNGSGVTSWASVAVSPLTTKGDLWGFSTVDTRVPVGANGTVLTADSSAAEGVSWQAPSATGTPVVVSVSANYTTTTADDVILVDASGGAVTITLPAATTPKIFYIKKIDSTSNAVIVAPVGGDVIDGDVNGVNMNVQWTAVTIVADGTTSWMIL